MGMNAVTVKLKTVLAKWPDKDGNDDHGRDGKKGDTTKAPPALGKEALQAWYKEAKGLLSKEAKDAVAKYQGLGYETVNSALRDGKGSLSDASESVQKMVAGLDEAIHANALPQAATLFRGMSFDTADVSSIAKGSVIMDHGFMSTSASKTTAEKAAGKNFLSKGKTTAVLTLSVPKGMSAFPVDAGGEKEVLLPRGTSIRVTGVKSENVRFTNEPRLYISAEVVAR